MVITYSFLSESVSEKEEEEEQEADEEEGGAECSSIGRKSRREGKERQTSKLGAPSVFFFFFCVKLFNGSLAGAAASHLLSAIKKKLHNTADITLGSTSVDYAEIYPFFEVV